MTGRTPFLFRFAVVVLLGSIGVDVRAQQPSDNRPPHPYDITPAAGSWAILVKSYSGKEAAALAFELVSELRREYKLRAYFFNRGDQARQEEEARVKAQREQRLAFYKQYGYEAPEKIHIKRLAHIEDQYAVLIADNYPDMDTARKDLDRIRKMKPPSEKLLDKGWRAVPAKNDKDKLEAVEHGVLNPFVTAFVVPNPTVPVQKDTEGDKQDLMLLREMNSDESYSLIHKCPGKWTLVVKVYRGPTVLMSRESEKSVLERIGVGGSKSSDVMGACGKQAHQFAELLRNKQLNFESFVLHTRNMSLVTVGSFVSEKDPRMAEMISTLSKLQLQVASGPAETLLNPPQPFPVPR
jgi:hypothetical protein